MRIFAVIFGILNDLSIDSKIISHSCSHCKLHEIYKVIKRKETHSVSVSFKSLHTLAIPFYMPSV